MFFNKHKKSPKFATGDTVMVKSRESIVKLIQPENKLDGCLFMEQMWDYCGNTYTVLKVVDYFYNDRQKRTFRPRAPLYLLEKIICNGDAGQLPSKCDRGCFILWHEDWLEKVQ
jgi:hypothetical protein